MVKLTAKVEQMENYCKFIEKKNPFSQRKCKQKQKFVANSWSFMLKNAGRNKNSWLIHGNSC